MLVTRHDRVDYVDALEAADREELGSLVRLFAARQRKAFVGALGIAREVAQEAERLDQVLASIGEMFAARDLARRQELESAKGLAESLRALAIGLFTQVVAGLQDQLGSEAGRRAWVDDAPLGGLDRHRRRPPRPRIIA